MPVYTVRCLYENSETSCTLIAENSDSAFKKISDLVGSDFLVEFIVTHIDYERLENPITYEKNYNMVKRENDGQSK